jgi:hypothetical protein
MSRRTAAISFGTISFGIRLLIAHDVSISIRRTKKTAA